MRPIFTLLRKDLACFFRDRAAVFMTFLVPALLIYLFGFVFGFNKSASSGPTGITIAVVNESKEPVALDLVEALKTEKTFSVLEFTKGTDGQQHPLTEEQVLSALKDNSYRYALVLPADLLPDDGLGVHIKFLSNPRNEIETQMVNGIIQKTVFSKVPSLLGQSLVKSGKKHIGADRFDRFNQDISSVVADAFHLDKEDVRKKIEKGGFFVPEIRHKKPESGLRRLDSPPAGSVKVDSTNTAEGDDDIFSRIVRLENIQVAGKQVKNPMAARVVGGYAIMFLLFAVSAASITLFEEKKNGILMRLLSTPVTRAHILGAKFLYGVIFGLLQLLSLFIVGHLLYDLDLFNHLVPLIAITLCAACVCSAYGMFVASVCSTPVAAHGLNTLLVLSMSAIGGAWFPVSFMPGFIQKLSQITPVYWSIEGFTSVLWAGQGTIDIFPTIGILCLMTTLILGVAIWRFNKGSLFD
jgi:ABC-2 type transport system permease protein